MTDDEDAPDGSASGDSDDAREERAARKAGLNALKGELHDDERAAARLQQQAEQTQAQIQALSAAIDEIQQVVTAYAAALPDIKKDAADIDRFIQTRTHMFRDELDGHHEAIDQILNELHHKGLAKQEHVDRLSAALRRLDGETDEQHKFAEAQTEYDDLKALPTTIPEAIAAHKALITRINGIDEIKVASRYALVRELHWRFIQTQRKIRQHPAELESNLVSAWERVRDAQHAINTLAQKRLDVQHDLETVRADLTAFHAEFIDHLLAKVQPFDTPSKASAAC